MNRKTAAVICPGRGTYNREELGYLGRHHGDKGEFLAAIDHYRLQHGQRPVRELDALPRYDSAVHNVGENVSAIIYACALADFADIDPQRFEIVAVSGNSMGWYLALACAGVLDPAGAIDVVNTMGSMMREEIIGGQLVYPLVDEEWRIVPARREQLSTALAAVNGQQGAEAHVSIDLGGMWVLGGNELGLRSLHEVLPNLDRYPMRLPNHAAFHTPLMDPVVSRARAALPVSLFNGPQLPLVDGFGRIWEPFATELEELYDYTLGAQINCPYSFSTAVEVLLKEFAPDVLIVPGPGSTLSVSIAQVLIQQTWLGIDSRSAFLRRQGEDPIVLAMGIEAQRRLVV